MATFPTPLRLRFVRIVAGIGHPPTGAEDSPMIPLTCEKCGKKFRIKDALEGKRARCPCGNVIEIPASTASVAMPLHTPEQSPYDPAREVFETVYRAYASFDADNEEGRQQLAAIRNQLKEWFHSAPRLVSQLAQYCIKRFVAEQLTHGPDQFQMPTELKSLQVQTFFGKRHSQLLSRRSSAELAALSGLFESHLVCGYLFSEYGYGHTARLARRSGSEVYEIWSPLTMSRVMASGDPKSKDEEDVQGLWMTATAQPIVNRIENWGARWEQGDNLILTRYFYAGRMLRWLEAIRLTDEEVKQLYAVAFPPV